MKLVALLIALGAAACVNRTYGSGASSGHPPPLPRSAGLPMWDHFCGIAAGTDGLTKLLDEASANGWEMVSYSISSDGNLVCFKRPHGSAPPAEPPPGVAPVSPPPGS
jgi:hypothetical protein